MGARPPLAEAWVGVRQAAGSPGSACAVFCARLAGKGACGRVDRQPVFLPVAPLLIVVENEEVCGAGFGFSFFGLRFSRLPRCSLLAMGTLRFCDSSTIAPSQPVLPIDWCRGLAVPAVDGGPAHRAAMRPLQRIRGRRRQSPPSPLGRELQGGEETWCCRRSRPTRWGTPIGDASRAYGLEQVT